LDRCAGGCHYWLTHIEFCVVEYREKMSGQDDGATAAASFTGFEPAPVSTRLMSGSVVVRSYGESWAGDESDILLPDQARAISGIDMTAWAIANRPRRTHAKPACHHSGCPDRAEMRRSEPGRCRSCSYPAPLFAFQQELRARVTRRAGG